MSVRSKLDTARLLQRAAFQRKTGLDADVPLSTEQQLRIALEAIGELERKIEALERKLRDVEYTALAADRRARRGF